MFHHEFNYQIEYHFVNLLNEELLIDSFFESTFIGFYSKCFLFISSHSSSGLFVSDSKSSDDVPAARICSFSANDIC